MMPPVLLWDAALATQRLPEYQVEVTATHVILGALATRDYARMHHDVSYAKQQSGTRDIFLNTPTQALWFQRYVTDWSGPHGRLGRMRFRMKVPVCPGDRLRMAGEVQHAELDAQGCGWVRLTLSMHVADRVTTECEARLALPCTADDNPWQRRGSAWQP